MSDYRGKSTDSRRASASSDNKGIRPLLRPLTLCHPEVHPSRSPGRRTDLHHPEQPFRPPPQQDPRLGGPQQGRTVFHPDLPILGQPDRGALRATTHVRDRRLQPPEPPSRHALSARFRTHTKDTTGPADLRQFLNTQVNKSIALPRHGRVTCWAQAPGLLLVSARVRSAVRVRFLPRGTGHRCGL